MVVVYSEEEEFVDVVVLFVGFPHWLFRGPGLARGTAPRPEIGTLDIHGRPRLKVPNSEGGTMEDGLGSIAL